jgi:hypothetical protein
MANKGPNTNRSQFFILYERQPHLNNLHTVFGRLLDGWEVLDKMERLPVMGRQATNKRDQNKPIEPPVIRNITIHVNPLADDMIIYPSADGPPEKRGWDVVCLHCFWTLVPNYESTMARIESFPALLHWWHVLSRPEVICTLYNWCYGGVSSFQWILIIVGVN